MVEEKLGEQGLTLLFAALWPGQSLFTSGPVELTADPEGAAFGAYNNATERLAQLIGAVSGSSAATTVTIGRMSVPDLTARG